MVVKGSCYCGQCEFELDEDLSNLKGVLCSCVTCQKLASDRSFNAPTSDDKLKVTKGEPKVFVDKSTDSGKSAYRSFCSNCGSALYTKVDMQPGAVYVKIGTLEGASQIPCAAEIYSEAALPGVDHHKGFQKETKRFEGMMAKEITA